MLKVHLLLLPAAVLVTILASCCFGFSSLAESSQYDARLKMVSLITRHGDRAPYTNFLPGDRFREISDWIWPNGPDKLTEPGKHRQFKNGLKLRHIYKDYLSFDPTEVLVLSSSVDRCVKSVKRIIRAMYNIEFTRQAGLDAIKKAKSCQKQDGCLPKTGGFAISAANQPINTSVVPTLNYKYIDSECAWYRNNPSPIDLNAILDKNVAALPGIEKLKSTLKSTYNASLTYSNVTDIYSQILNELQVASTNETYAYTDHFNNWIFEQSADSTPDITLFDVLEEAAFLVYKNRISYRQEVSRIQNGPILTSIIDSYKIALNQSNSVTESSTIELYKNKKMVLYGTHDNVVMALMDSLNLFEEASSYENRFYKYHKEADYKQYLNGIRMPSYAVSVRFELYELENKRNNEKWPVVRAFLYNKADGKFSDINYHRLKIGKACQRLYQRKYPNGNASDYYKSRMQFQLERDYNCPFELLKNLTAPLMIKRTELNQLCDD